jgi:hypothetical protein
MQQNVARLRSCEVLVATALILTLLLAGCASTQLATIAETSPTAPPRLLPSDKKGSIRTIGVVTGGDTQLALHAYEKDFGADIATTTIAGGLGGFALGFLGACIFEFGVRSSVVAFGGPNADYGPIISLFLPPVLLTTMIGGGGVFVLAAANSVPARRGEEIEAAVLPAFTDFSFQESLVEQVLAAGTRNTQYSFRDLHRADAGDHISGQADTMLKVSVLNVGLRKAGKDLQFSVVVRAQLIQGDTGTTLVQRTFSHVWRTFARSKPAAGDELLTREEVDSCLRVLSDDIVDTLFLTEDFPTLFSAEISAPPVTRSFDGLQPRNPKPEQAPFGAKWKSGAVGSLQPRLAWVPFPGQRDKEMDTKGRLNEIGRVSYDLRIWRLAEEMHHPPELVYERTCLIDPWHTVEQTLEPGTMYYWAVRARFVRDGHAGVTQWTTCPGLLPLFTKEGSMMGESSFLSQLSGMYKFSTPALTGRFRPPKRSAAGRSVRRAGSAVQGSLDTRVVECVHQGSKRRGHFGLGNSKLSY